MSSKRGNPTQVAASIPFDNEPEGTPIFTQSSPETVQEAISAGGEKAQTALDTPRYTILLQNNGTVSDNTFIGYNSLIPGDATPVIVPVQSEFLEFTFSNARTDADYTLEFRRNTLVGTPFFSVSKVNVQFFSQDNIDEPFNAGDQIYVKYIDDGTNASDAVILLTFRAIPQ